MLAAAIVTAVATAMLAVFAVVTAIFAIKAFGKQSQEVRDQAAMLKVQSDQLAAQRDQLRDQQALNARQTEVLELQAHELRESLDARKRQADERRRTQAEQVFTRVDRPGATPADIPGGASYQIAVHVKNASAQPIRGVMFTWYRGHSFWGEPETVPYLMPGDEHSAARRLPDDLAGNIDLRIFGATVMFRDRAKVLWRIKPDGSLVEVQPDEPPDAMLGD
jgi:hypothetical protein